MNVLVIDNNLFAHSVVEVLEKKDCNVTVFRGDSDLRTLEGGIKKAKPKLIIIAGGAEDQHTESVQELIQNNYQSIPFFGIGFGLHVIAYAFEGRVDRGAAVLHGKTCKVQHDSKTIFKGLPEPFTAGRYNSLFCADVPYNFEVSARDESGAVMAIRHKETFLEAVQFHPESILTPSGSQLLDSVLSEVRK